ncbi:MAG TPA: hypothetical protein ENJ82_01355 [Bacteroidetes bacterium]|nr:hypothetical protein [Bacteroidota bacterium]
MWFFHFLHWGGIVTWWGELGFSLAIFIAAALKIPALRKQAAEASKVRLAEARKELEEMDF